MLLGLICFHILLIAINSDAARCAFSARRMELKVWAGLEQVVSDWGGTHSTRLAAEAGLDMEMNTAQVT